MIMDYFEEFGFKAPKQQRGIKAIDDILQSLEVLPQSEGFTKVTTQDISDRSGYAVGTIFHHFRKLDNIFIYLFLIRRKKAILNIANIINKHPADQPLSVLMSHLVYGFIDEFSKVNRKKLIFVVNQFFKRTKYPMLINLEGDILIPLWMNASQRDETNTIFNFNEDELRLRLRAIQAIARSPFFENDAIAGTAQHKKIAFNLFMQIFMAQD